MQHPKLLKGITVLSLVLLIGIYSCNDTAKDKAATTDSTTTTTTNMNTTTSPATTTRSTTVKKDSSAVNDTIPVTPTKTEQAPPVKN